MQGFEADGILGIRVRKKIQLIAFNWAMIKGLSSIGCLLAHQDPSQHPNFSNAPITAYVFLIDSICHIAFLDSRSFSFNMITIR